MILLLYITVVYIYITTPKRVHSYICNIDLDRSMVLGRYNSVACRAEKKKHGT